jgi:hypothetical protein
VFVCRFLAFVENCLTKHTLFLRPSCPSRARVQFVASHAAMENLLLPNVHEQDMPESATASAFRHYYLPRQGLRWLVVLTFLLSTVWISMYLIINLVNEKGGIGGSIVWGFLCIPMVYNLWVTYYFTVVVSIGQAIPNGRCKSKVKEKLEQFNNCISHAISTYVFGIDTNDTEHGEVAPRARHVDDDLVARLERIEKTLEKALASKDTIGDRDDPDDSCISFPPLPL